METLAPLKQFAQRATAAQFCKNIKVMRVLKVVPVGEDVPMLAQVSMNADLGAQFLSRLDLLQVRFADNFGRHHDPSLIVSDLVHTREGTFPNERT